MTTSLIRYVQNIKDIPADYNEKTNTYTFGVKKWGDILYDFRLVFETDLDEEPKVGEVLFEFNGHQVEKFTVDKWQPTYKTIVKSDHKLVSVDLDFYFSNMNTLLFNKACPHGLRFIYVTMKNGRNPTIYRKDTVASEDLTFIDTPPQTIKIHREYEHKISGQQIAVNFGSRSKLSINDIRFHYEGDIRSLIKSVKITNELRFYNEYTIDDMEFAGYIKNSHTIVIPEICYAGYNIAVECYKDDTITIMWNEPNLMFLSVGSMFTKTTQTKKSNLINNC
jgi:hypothetical protein